MLPSSGRIDIKFIANNSNGESRVQLFDETDSLLVKGDFNGSYNGNTELKAGTYYLSFSSNNNKSSLGSYTLQLKTSDLKATHIKSLVSSKAKNVRVKWKKISGASGYQIQFATNRKFTKNKKSYSTTNTSYTMRKLKSKKTYNVRIRAYTLADNNKKCYSAWSKIKKIKVK